MQNTLETQIINKAERTVYKPLIKIKHEESVMPSYEIILKRNYLLVLRSMAKYSRFLCINATHYMETQQKPIKLRVGFEFTFFFQTKDYK